MKNIFHPEISRMMLVVVVKIIPAGLFVFFL